MRGGIIGVAPHPIGVGKRPPGPPFVGAPFTVFVARENPRCSEAQARSRKHLGQIAPHPGRGDTVRPGAAIAGSCPRWWKVLAVVRRSSAHVAALNITDRTKRIWRWSRRSASISGARPHERSMRIESFAALFLRRLAVFSMRASARTGSARPRGSATGDGRAGCGPMRYGG